MTNMLYKTYLRKKLQFVSILVFSVQGLSSPINIHHDYAHSVYNISISKAFNNILFLFIFLLKNICNTRVKVLIEK